MSYVEHCKKHGQYHGEICGECFEELQKAYYEQEEELDATMMAFQIVQKENSKLRETLQLIVDSGPASPGDKKHEIAKAALAGE
jgi:hypothetical protein